MIESLQYLIRTEDGKILFILTLICLAMIFDFLTGTLNAMLNKNVQFTSNIGINGILRKILSLVILIFFIPISVIIPYNAGRMILYVLYLGYLLSELTSVFETLESMGVDVVSFQQVLTKMKRLLELTDEKEEK